MLMQKKLGPSVATFSDQVKRGPVFASEQVAAVIDYISSQSGSTVDRELVRQALRESVEFRKYCSNSEDIVSSSLESFASQGRSRREDSTSCSENICYFEESGLLGRVQELRDRTACLMCIPVSEIECSIGIIANMFTNKEYILDGNLILRRSRQCTDRLLSARLRFDSSVSVDVRGGYDLRLIVIRIRKVQYDYYTSLCKTLRLTIRALRFVTRKKSYSHARDFHYLL
ncbi:hypothetical protein POJ06DRAFT_284239 [Lipomyces tetrasporus]|uniref:Uncharacterized protein n=1 Tax=Lipomyces tetrasporus TaxID=54092 RepID=A0AAD7QXU5_9ASCO|nr:uncharacterized protein POJ06DRAFT_284239 [Lipomyces tetrasporus]KAJ8103440.1 hypothetical protein POJ06DRAFT_284239 [Lipomyces tetrasporus]